MKWNWLTKKRMIGLQVVAILFSILCIHSSPIYAAASPAWEQYIMGMEKLFWVLISLLCFGLIFTIVFWEGDKK